MRNRVPFMLTLCFGLGVASINAQSVVPTSGVENEKEAVPDVASRRVGETRSATLQKYDKLPLAFERSSASEFLARG